MGTQWIHSLQLRDGCLRGERPAPQHGSVQDLHIPPLSFLCLDEALRPQPAQDLRIHRHHELRGMSSSWYSDLTSEVLLKENSTWSQGPDLPDPLDSACALPLDGNNFVTIGGGRRHSTVSKYDTATETWDHTWPQLPEGRRGHSCARLGSILVVAGGFSYESFQYTDSTLTINAATGFSILQFCTMYSENSSNRNTLHWLNGLIQCTNHLIIWNSYLNRF